MIRHATSDDAESRREVSPFRYFGNKLINTWAIAYVHHLVRNGSNYIDIYFQSPDSRAENKLVSITIDDAGGLNDYSDWVHEQGLCPECNPHTGRADSH